MIKVAHITTVDMSLRHLLLGQLVALQRAGYDVTAISAAGPDVPAIEAAGIRHLAVPMTRQLTPLQDARALGHLYRLMRREQFTIVHTHTPKPGLLGQVAARVARVPVVVNTIHGFYFHAGSPPAARRFYMTLEKIAARCSDVIFSVNPEDVDTATREGIATRAQMRLLGPGGIGVDVRRFDRQRLAPEAVARKRAEVGLPDGAPVVGFVGRLVREKGLLDLLAAARLVGERMPAARFLIVGPVDAEKGDAVTPAMAGEYGVAERCLFLGTRHDMPELYALMDVLVLPSYREGFPRAPMEASAMGVPCVVTDIRGCRDAVQHGRNGLLVPVGNAGALADAIVELLTDGETARRMGAEGRRMALEQFDERQVFATVLAEYARLLRQKGLPPPPAASG